MDKTSEYINKCYLSDEIQKNWDPKTGDWCANIQTKEIIVLSNYTITNFDGLSFKIHIPKKIELETLIADENIDSSFNHFTTIQSLDFEGYSRKEWIFLPRTDQLIKMVERYETTYNQINALMSVFNTFRCNKEKYVSSEQLWLDTLMLDRYNKKWNGENWIEYRDKIYVCKGCEGRIEVLNPNSLTDDDRISYELCRECYFKHLARY